MLNNLLFTVPFANSKWIVGVFWTLAIGFQFYIFIGILFALLFEHKKLWWFIVIYILVVWAQVLFYTHDSFLQYSSLFTLRGVTLLWQQQRLTPLAYGSLLLLFSDLVYWHIDSYVAMVGLLTALSLNALQMQLPGFGFLGKMSYSFYLLHILIGTSCEFFLIKIITPVSVINKSLITFLVVIIALIGSYIFYRLIEQPFLRLVSR